jgi:predicted Rossmann fold nucleotide-binding protein DprA/Smf involved in DNA uptake
MRLAQNLQNAKDRVAELQAEWDALFMIPTQSQSVKKKGGRRPSTNGYATRVLAAINDDPVNTWNAERAEQRTGLPRKQVEKALFNLYTAGKIQRVSRGIYASNESVSVLTAPAEVVAVN